MSLDIEEFPGMRIAGLMKLGSFTSSNSEYLVIKALFKMAKN
jgi:hypothetical protein